MIRDWLVLPPFQVGGVATGDVTTDVAVIAAFNVDYIDEATVRPAIGTASGGKGWLVHEEPDPTVTWIDFTKYFYPSDRAVFYGFTYIYSPNDRDGKLLVHSDDAVKVWLNHEMVHANLVFRGVEPIDVVPIVLKQGWNSLLVKIVNQGGPTGFRVDVVNPDEREYADLLYSLVPPSTAPAAGQWAPSQPTNASTPSPQTLGTVPPGYTPPPDWVPANVWEQIAVECAKLGIFVTPTQVFYGAIGAAALLFVVMIL